MFIRLASSHASASASGVAKDYRHVPLYPVPISFPAHSKVHRPSRTRTRWMKDVPFIAPSHCIGTRFFIRLSRGNIYSVIPLMGKRKKELYVP